MSTCELCCVFFDLREESCQSVLWSAVLLNIWWLAVHGRNLKVGSFLATIKATTFKLYLMLDFWVLPNHACCDLHFRGLFQGHSDTVSVSDVFSHSFLMQLCSSFVWSLSTVKYRDRKTRQIMDLVIVLGWIFKWDSWHDFCAQGN